MAGFNNLFLVYEENNTNAEINYSFRNKKLDFETISIYSLFTLYLTAYEKFIGSYKSMILFRKFIQTTNVLIDKFIESNTGPQKTVITQFRDTLLNLQNENKIKSTININDFSMLMGNYEIDNILNKFYIPFLTILENNKPDTEPNILMVNPVIVNISSLQDTDDIVVIFKKMNGIFVDNKDNIISKDILKKYISGFVLKFSDNNLFNELNSFFLNFRINYMPDIRNNIGLLKFTIFDVFSFITSGNNLIDLNKINITGLSILKNFLENNKISKNKLLNTINKYSNVTQKNIYYLLEILFNPSLSNSAPSTALEGVEDDNTDDDNTDDDNTDDDNTDNDNTDDDNTDDDNTDDDKKEENKKVPPSPIGLKIELAEDDETLEDFLFKKNVYNQLKQYLHDDKIKNADKTLLKVILNQWLFMLNTKTVKKIEKTFSTLYSIENA